MSDDFEARIRQLEDELADVKSEMEDRKLREGVERNRQVLTVSTNVVGVGVGVGVAGALGVLLAELSAKDERDWLGSLILSAMFVAVVLPLISLGTRWLLRVVLTLVSAGLLCLFGRLALDQHPMDLVPVVAVCVFSVLPDLAYELTPRLLDWFES